MAPQVLTDAVFIWDGEDHSDHLISVDGPFGREMLDDSAMSDTTRSNKAGAAVWSVTATFFSDEAASENMADMYPALVAGTVATVELRPTSAARSATNPGYNGSGVIESMQTVSGDYGAMQTTQVVIRSAGDQTRSTS